MAAKPELVNLISGMMEHAGAHGIGDVFVETVKHLMEHSGEHATTAVQAAGLAAGSVFGAPIVVPLAIYMSLFGIAEAVKRRRESKDKAEQEEAGAHVSNVLQNVQNMLKGQQGAIETLAEIAERKCPVWARLSGADRAMLTRETAAKIKPALEMLGADLSSTLADHWVVGIDTNERVRRLEELLAVLGARGAWQRRSIRPLFRTSLPDRDPRFVGRTEELSELHHRLVAHGQQGIAQQAGLSSAGGIGKTSLAVEYGWTHLSEYPGGVFFIRASAGSLEAELAALAVVLGLPASDNVPSTARAVKEHLESLIADDGKPMPSLLILDNVTAKDHWHNTRWRDLLPRGFCRRIVTTRDARFDRLDLLSLNVLSLADSLRLLGNFRPIDTEEERRAAQGIARWFGGWAIGLATAGARLRMKGGLTYVELANALSRMGFGAVELAESDLSDSAGGALPLVNYDERIGAVLNDLFQKLSSGQQLALKYAAMLPQDAIPRPWLIHLIENHDGFTLPPTLKSGGHPAEALIDDLQLLGLFVTSAELPNVVVLHAVRRAWIRNRLGDSPDEHRIIREAVLQHARKRSVWLSQADEHGWERWIVSPSRWELEPLLLLTFTPGATQSDHEAVATILNNLAYCLNNLGRSAEALPKLQEALEMHQRLFKGDHQDMAASVSNLALCLNNLGRSAEALPKFQAAVEMTQRLFKGDHPDVATSVNNFAYCLNFMGRSAEALPRYQVAQEMRQRLVKGDHPDVALSLNNVAVCLNSLGRSMEASSYHRAATKMRERLLKQEHPNGPVG